MIPRRKTPRCKTRGAKLQYRDIVPLNRGGGAKLLWQCPFEHTINLGVFHKDKSFPRHDCFGKSVMALKLINQSMYLDLGSMLGMDLTQSGCLLSNSSHSILKTNRSSHWRFPTEVYVVWCHLHCCSVADPDPYHFPGSGSVSNYMDPDTTKTNETENT